MSEPTGGLQIVAASDSGWCEPGTGVCHVDTIADETAVVEPSGESAGTDVPRTTRR
jgi:hypothetical protein